MTNSDSDMRSIARGGLLNLIGAAISVVVNLGTTVAITRILTQGGAGRFFAATSLFLLFESVVISGATTGVVYFVARTRAMRRFGDMRRSLRFAAGPVMSASLLVAITVPIWASWASSLLSNGGENIPASALIVLLVGLPLAAVSDTALAATTGYRLMRPTVVVERIFRPAVQGLLVLAVLPTHNATALVAAWVGPYLLSSLWAVVWLRRLVARDPQRNLAPAGGAVDSGATPLTRKAFWSYTAPRGISSVAATALQRLDIVLVSVLSGSRDAALYTAATRFLIVGQLIGAALASSVQPRLAGWFALHDLESVARTYRTATAWGVLATWPFYLVCAWTAPYWLDVFGHGYRDATSVVVILVASMLLATGCGMVSTVLVMGGRTRDNLLNTVVALGCNVGIDLILIPHIGIRGAAIGWAVSIAANNLLPLSQVWRQFKMQPIGMATIRAALLTALCLAAVPALGIAITSSRLSMALLFCAVGLLAYIVVVVRWYDSFDLGAFLPAGGSRRLDDRSGRHRRRARS